MVHLCEDEGGDLKGGGVTVVKAVESSPLLLRVFVHIRSGGVEREVSVAVPVACAYP